MCYKERRIGMNAITISNLSKVYKIYDNPKDRVLEAFHIGKKQRYTEFKALNDVNFSVEQGETVGIIGTNGAGKSTLLKIITGVLNPTQGSVDIHGKVSALLELGAGFNQEYTGIENIYLNGRMMGYTKKEMDERRNGIIEFADIGDFIEQPVKTYSSGMFARLAFAVAINVEPDILIVDEALSVGDVFFQNKCFTKFDELKKKGVTILFVSHDIESVRQMCSRVLWLDHGKARAFGNTMEICDMYMDKKRKDTVYVSGHITDEGKEEIVVQQIDEEKKYPKLDHVDDRFHNNKVRIRSAYFTDVDGEYANTQYVDNFYNAHIVVECLENMHDLIVGFVVENKKGLPMYDMNNYINRQKVISGIAGQVLEIVFHYKLPRVMNGVYLISATVAQGTQSKHEMLTWLHAVRQLEIVNTGYNSSYIEIPGEIDVYSNNKENVVFL